MNVKKITFTFSILKPHKIINARGWISIPYAWSWQKLFDLLEGHDWCNRVAALINYLRIEWTLWFAGTLRTVEKYVSFTWQHPPACGPCRDEKEGLVWWFRGPQLPHHGVETTSKGPPHPPKDDLHDHSVVPGLLSRQPTVFLAHTCEKSKQKL